MNLSKNRNQRWKWVIKSPGDRPEEVIELLLGLSGRERVLVNNREVISRISWRFKNTHEFFLDDGRFAKITVTVDWKTLGLVPKCVLFVENEEIAPTEPKEPAGLLKPGVPKWVSWFMVPLFAIPFATGGGLIPVAIAFIGFSGISKIATQKSWPEKTKISLSIAIVGCAWIASLSSIRYLGPFLRELLSR